MNQQQNRPQSSHSLRGMDAAYSTALEASTRAERAKALVEAREQFWIRWHGKAQQH
jgi:hypothetical protein